MERPCVATLTMNPAIDLSYEVDRVEPTRKLRAHDERYAPGGGGINVARVLARLETDAHCVFPSGGVTGPIFNALVARQGMETTSVPIAGTTRIATTVFETTTGNEYRFTPAGPDLGETEWRACLEAIGGLGCQWLVASGSLPGGVPADFYARLVAGAAGTEMKLVLDSSGAALRAGIEGGGVFLAKPNLAEFEELAGRSFAEPAEIGAAAQDMVRAYGMTALVVTLGMQGALLATAEGHEICRAVPLEAKSAVGAGDSFVAGMVHALAGGEELAAAFRFGMAAGSAAILTPGSGLALREDIDRLADAYRSA